MDNYNALDWHLRSNFYPPITDMMIPFCQKAIALVRDGLPHLEIDFPNGDTITAGLLVEELRLDDMCEVDDDALVFDVTGGN